MVVIEAARDLGCCQFCNPAINDELRPVVGAFRLSAITAV